MTFFCLNMIDYSWENITPSFRKILFDFLKTHEKYQTESLLKKLGIIKENGELKLKEE